MKCSILQAHFNINTYKYCSCRKTRSCASDFKCFCLLFIIIIYLPIWVFVYLPVYFARMNFPVGHFGKIDSLSKMCNLDNSCKNFDKCFSFTKSNLREKSFTHLRHFVTFLLFLFSLKNNLTSRQSKQKN